MIKNTRSWMKKVVLPTFKGTDPIGWLALTDKFFAVQKVEPSKLKVDTDEETK